LLAIDIVNLLGSESPFFDQRGPQYRPELNPPRATTNAKWHSRRVAIAFLRRCKFLGQVQFTRSGKQERKNSGLASLR
jgi:hypothetical protein